MLLVTKNPPSDLHNVAYLLRACLIVNIINTQLDFPV